MQFLFNADIEILLSPEDDCRWNDKNTQVMMFGIMNAP